MAEKKVYTEVAPSGVLVVSEVPFVEPKWWDSPWLHLIWSYASWGSMILKQYGHPGMRNYLHKRGWW